MIMEALGNQFIILKIYVKEFISQQTLNKSINFVIRTRTFENYNEIVRCSACNAITCEGMLPRRRFIEGLKMKQWQCPNRKCRFFNTIEMSLACKQCGTARPKNTLPLDIMFPLYVPTNATVELNRYASVLEKLLTIIPMVEVTSNLTEELKAIKQKEKGKATKDFDKINIVEDFLNIRANFINIKKMEQGFNKIDAEQEMKFEQNIEEKFCDMLCERIVANIERRNEHQAILDQNQQMIKEINERVGYIEVQQKKLVTDLGKIMKNAKFGIGSEFLLNKAF